MDVGLFLALPVDIRVRVYYHLDGNFNSVTPDPIEQLYCDKIIKLAPQAQEDRNSGQKLLRKKLYGIFARYLNIFDYSPLLIDRWLEYALWLRYDSIVLDCMRLNHAYGGALIGQMDWIYLDGRLRLGYFKNCMLVVWYTLREYARWIIREETQEEDLDGISFFRLNVEYSSLDLLKRIFNSMRNNDLFLLLSEVFLEEDGETDLPALVDDDNDQIAYPIEDLKVIELLGKIELMKNLNKISVRGDRLFEALINFHGVRDNPGRTISYMVRKRIMRLELWQLNEPARSGLADFTKWENLRELRFVNINTIDLNKLVIPNVCKMILLDRVSEVVWWDLETKISSVIEGSTITRKLNGTTKLRFLDRNSLKSDNLGQCQSIVWQAFKHLNFLKLQNVTKVRGGKIVIPCALYNNKRILVFPTTSCINEIIVI
ncbi:hypothetical protein HG537_0A03930 [Torulaspora globosa]|uniref:Uncharacterized protein n=1 Tax=Torulaspora globosa TaxID=48254 RepID=A0A7H9HLD2_9SACH|nr:hypothetical protein HG537_0A03930 [Torulaspora sp. CBS 2947]